MNKKYKYKFYYVYQIINSITNKSYIGWHATNNMNDKYFGSGKYLKRSIKKYNQVNFSKIILEQCNENNILRKEIYWISEKNTLAPNGYNLTLGGEGSLGRVASPETREKLRLAPLGKKASPQTRKKLSDSHKGKKYLNYKSHPISEETKQKISNANKNRTHTEQSKLNMSNGQIGKKLSEKHKEKLRLSQLGSTHNLKELRCPRCGLIGKGGNMTRYHFNNCKY